ncbi:putative proteasome endopeptidase complex [Rosa chinensis]|uniref:Putative proteasome endopeptidase complex n=1 Tax=Rosa chinensis TaxID=74649 RepID=A0A2P6PYC5_ROSCH|nr:putative proteasome endopeptidase complex [Rosa chinensis]
MSPLVSRRSLSHQNPNFFCLKFSKIRRHCCVYVANLCSDKITQLTDNVYVCRSGSAADSQVVSYYVRHFLHQHMGVFFSLCAFYFTDSIQLWQPATGLLSYGNKAWHNMLQTGLIVGGWDKYEKERCQNIQLLFLCTRLRCQVWFLVQQMYFFWRKVYDIRGFTC